MSTQGCLDQRDLARRFTLEYFRNPYRGYGRGVVDIFEKLREQEDFSDCLGPSKAQFGGSGSYGNGGAMRVHPVALFCGPEATRDILEETAKDSAMVTHAHKGDFDVVSSIRTYEFNSRQQTGSTERFCRPTLFTWPSETPGTQNSYKS